MAAHVESGGRGAALGSDRGRPWRIGDRTLKPTAQVVPGVPSFSVDDGFRYSIPEGLSGVEIGAVVRVPLGGRRVRGYVVSQGAAPEDARLKDITAVSGDIPVFHRGLLETMRWLAIHYVAPLGGALALCAPPNLPRRRDQAPAAEEIRIAPSNLLPAASAAAAGGGLIRPQYLVSGAPPEDTTSDLIGEVVVAGHSCLIVLPTVPEAEDVARSLRGAFGARVILAHSALGAAAVTSLWVRAVTQPGTVVVGTREVALWPVAGLAMAVVVQEGRRAMKSPQTPTFHVREVLRRRAAVERFQLVLTGHVPTAEAMAARVEVVELPGRAWGLVEVVDRTEDPPGSGFVSARARHALRLVVDGRKSAFVLVNRRGFAPAFRCVRCRAVRRCTVCGTAADRGDICRRCSHALGACVECGARRFEPLGAGIGRLVEELRAVLGAANVSPAGEGEAPVIIGTERDLPGRYHDIAVAIDADGPLFSANYRAAEDALRLHARLAGTVRPGSGNRTIVQTAIPSHPVFAALRSGHPVPFIRDELAARARDGFPPATELVAIEVRGDVGPADEELRAVTPDTDVFGPAASADGSRWLVGRPDLRAVKLRLRPVVQRWRDRGLNVRIDADPQDI